MPKIILDVSPQLYALATGFAGFEGRTVEEYALSALIGNVSSDSEANLVEECPDAEKLPSIKPGRLVAMHMPVKAGT